MSSTCTKIERNLYRGINRAVGRHQLADGEVWNCLNFRPARGELSVTPPLIASFSLSNLTDEAAQSQIKLLQLVRNLNSQLRYLIINHKTARYVDPTNTATQVQVPVVVQTAKPDNTTVTGECLLYGFNTTDFAATDDEIEVEIQTATTFRWRRNGGSWTSGVVIGPEVALGANGLKVSFQDDEGYTAGNVWKWKRSWNHPYTGADSTTDKFPFSKAVYNKDFYVGGLERNIMRVRDDFLTSVGYTRVYGKHVFIYQNHLFVSQYAAGVYDAISGIRDGYNAATTPFTIGWSHLENPDQFYSTDVNEADEYPFPQQGAHDWSNLGITGVGELSNQLFVYLPDAVKVGNYVGLPTVMQFRTVHPKIGNLFPAGLVHGVGGHYFISRGDVYKFDGNSFISIGQKVIDKFNSEIVPITDSRYQMTLGCYDDDRNEVIFTYWTNPATGVYQARQMIFSETTNEWYFRNLPSASSSATDIYCQTRLAASWGKMIYGGSGVVYQDWVSGSGGTYAKDDITTDPNNAKYTVPLIETVVSDYGHKHAMKETTAIHLDYGDQSAGTVIPLTVSVIKGRSLKKLSAYASVGTYNPSSPQAGEWLTFAKQVGRVLGYKFEIGDGSAVVRDGGINGYEEAIYGIPNTTEK